MLAAVAAAIVIVAAVVAVLVARRRHEPVASTLKPAPRDVILVTIDTLRADAVGYAGNTRVKTPFLDSLAAKAIVFTNAHAHNVITLPSHVNILTGLYPFQHGVRENAGFTLSPKIPTVASMLKPLGYATGAFVGAFPLDARFGLNQGFDHYDDNYGKGQATVDFVMQERRADAVLSAAASWWRAHRGQKRFMWVHLFDPHAPYAPPEPFLSEYRGDEYHGEIAWVDSQLQAQLGPILAEDLDALVIVTGDHGEALGDHGELTHGLFAYESTLKIPLIVEGAGLGHRTEDAYVRHIDIVPTILAAVGGRQPSDLRGVPLTATIDSRDSYFESLSASLNRGWAPLTGIIHSGEKYIDLPIAELYDLPNDPKEKNNLRDARRRDVDAARKLLAPSMVAPGPRSVDAATLANLRSLGYISGSGAPKKTYTAADDPKNLVGLDSRIHQAIDAFERHQPARALGLARQVVDQQPDMTAGREILAFMLQQNDRIPEAIEQLKIILNDRNANDDDRVQLALLYCETGHPEQAVHLLQDRANDRDPDLLNAYGVALLDAGRDADADQEFQHILSIDPNNAPALQNLGIAALRKGDRANARTYLMRALALNPRLPDALNTLGVVYAQERQYAEAVNAWKRAVSVDPRQYDALFNTGLVEGSLGHRDSAREALTRFVNTAPAERYGPDIAKAKRGLAKLR
ncbi:MAG TPA: sulfatase-like hydrolase/transferase [Thermoanaerobaculia bacterium]|nr:sulfatase-like hydrolase/transferase [Thermoanaerobaculia bacterium]